MRQYYKYEDSKYGHSTTLYYIEANNMYQYVNGNWEKYYFFVPPCDRLSNERYIKITEDDLFLELV